MDYHQLFTMHFNKAKIALSLASCHTKNGLWFFSGFHFQPRRDAAWNTCTMRQWLQLDCNMPQRVRRNMSKQEDIRSLQVCRNDFTPNVLTAQWEFAFEFHKHLSIVLSYIYATIQWIGFSNATHSNGIGFRLIFKRAVSEPQINVLFGISECDYSFLAMLLFITGIMTSDIWSFVNNKPYNYEINNCVPNGSIVVIISSLYFNHATLLWVWLKPCCSSDLLITFG